MKARVEGTSQLERTTSSDGSECSRDSRFLSFDQVTDLGCLDAPRQKRGSHCELPPDFLRVPKPVIDQWWEIEDINNRINYKQQTKDRESDDEFDLPSDTEEEEIDQAENSRTTTILQNGLNVPLNHRYSIQIVKDDTVGLGLKLKFLSKYGPVVHSVSTGAAEIGQTIENGVAEKAGIRPGDILVSVNINGITPVKLQSLAVVASLIKCAPRCFSLTLDRPPNQLELADAPFEQVPSTTQHNMDSSRRLVSMGYRAIPLAPLSTLLHAQGLLKSRSEAQALSIQLYTIFSRSRRWQKHNNLFIKEVHLESRGFLSSLLWGRGAVGVGGEASVGGMERSDVISVPITGNREKNKVVSTQGIRPALVIRVLGLSQVNDHTEYIVWVLDVLSGVEWKVYRRFREFQRLEEEFFCLRSAMRSVMALDFPQRRLSHIYESVPGATALERASKLSRWLRRVVALLPGCDAEEMLFPARSGLAVAEALERFLEASPRAIDERVNESPPSDPLMASEAALARVVHVIAHRILSLPVIERAVAEFISRLGQLYESQCHTPSAVAFEMGESLLAPMTTFINLMRDCILKGCETELRKYLNQHLDQSGIQIPPNSNPHKCVLKQSLLRGVRRAVEAEVYVPLMGKLHRSLLGVGALDEDSMKLHRRRVRSTASQIGGFKSTDVIQAQLQAGIHPYCTSTTGWKAITVLFNKMNKGHSLPCDQIRALVEAGRTIPALYREEHCESNDCIGADDVLPVFIFALARSEIRDLVAVRRVLHALCDDSLREGEEGYYLATLGAATDHIVALSKKSKKK